MMIVFLYVMTRRVSCAALHSQLETGRYASSPINECSEAGSLAICDPLVQEVVAVLILQIVAHHAPSLLTQTSNHAE